MRTQSQTLICRLALTAALTMMAPASAQQQPEPSEPGRVRNDYYINPEAKEVIDAIIKAHGGRKNIEGIDRVKLTMHTRAFAGESDITIYQTRSAIRRDTRIGDKTYVECFNGREVWMSENNEDQATPAGLITLLEYEIDKGMLRQPMLDTLVSKDELLSFRGEVKYREKPCWLIETRDVYDRTIRNYFDAENHLAFAKVTALKDGGERAEIFNLYDRFQGVVYVKQVALVDENNELKATMEITEITSDFSDSVFQNPASEPSSPNRDKDGGSPGL